MLLHQLPLLSFGCAGLAAAGLGGLSLLGAADVGATELAGVGAIAAGSLQLFLLQQLLSFRRDLGEIKGRCDACANLPRRKHSQHNQAGTNSPRGMPVA
jgi:hypothetical protein